jgi:hypothetical protein
MLYAHPKIHLSAEQSVHEIAANGIAQLEPSSRFTSALHEGLFFSKRSSLATERNPLSINCIPGCVRLALSTAMPHGLHPALRVLPYYDFIWQAHGIVAREVRKHKLGVNPAHLTNNMVIHSIDHFSATQVFHADAIPLGESGTLLEYLRCSIWLHFWTPVETAWNPVENEYLARMPQGGFYHDVYNALKEVDPELTAHILTSTSF